VLPVVDLAELDPSKTRSITPRAPAAPGKTSAAIRAAAGDGAALTQGRKDAPSTPLPELAFSVDELAAFQRIASYLRPNPRHVKRLVNVYALVRALAERLGERRILDRPSTTVAWLALCAQWPYAAREMLRQHDVLERQRTGGAAAGKPVADPAAAPLQYLLAAAEADLDPVNRRRFDHDTESLGQIVVAARDMTWPELRTLRRFTLNFNPALESELRVSEQRRTRRSHRRAAAGLAEAAAHTAEATAPAFPPSLPGARGGAAT
jgi:hypothetical protein